MIPSHDPTGSPGTLSGPLQVGAVFRRNSGTSNTKIVIDGSTEVVLVKHSHLSKAPVGIHVTNRTADVFLIGNSFEDVHQEHCYDTLAMHERACYYPPTVWPARQPPTPESPATDPDVDHLTGVRKATWLVQQEERGY
jgi:hypothetical protein